MIRRLLTALVDILLVVVVAVVGAVDGRGGIPLGNAGVMGIWFKPGADDGRARGGSTSSPLSGVRGHTSPPPGKKATACSTPDGVNPDGVNPDGVNPEGAKPAEELEGKADDDAPDVDANAARRAVNLSLSTPILPEDMVRRGCGRAVWTKGSVATLRLRAIPSCEPIWRRKHNIKYV